jgi:hypothetical protein
MNTEILWGILFRNLHLGGLGDVTDNMKMDLRIMHFFGGGGGGIKEGWIELAYFVHRENFLLSKTAVLT